MLSWAMTGFVRRGPSGFPAGIQETWYLEAVKVLQNRDKILSISPSLIGDSKLV